MNAAQIQSMVDFSAASSADTQGLRCSSQEHLSDCNYGLMDTGEFQYPKNPVKPKASDQLSVASTSNSFDVLDSADSDSASDKGYKPDKNVKPPPVIIYGISNKYNFTKSLSSTFTVAPKYRHAKDFITFQVLT